jgi:hypothetical protein
MHTATVTLKSISPYSQSRCYEMDVPKEEKESSKDYELRTWHYRMHVNQKGNVYIPPMSFKNCLSEAAKYLTKQIPGKGKSTYTKHFEAGVLVADPLVLPIKKDDVQGEWLFVPASGKRGDGKRVWRKYPLIPEWSGNVVFHVLDDTITKDVFADHIRESGNFIGIGRFRPRNNGFYGRFTVADLQWA